MNSSSRVSVAVLSLPVLLLAALSFPWIALAVPWDPDESRYLEIGREMAQGGDWLVPTLNGVPYLEKPPLYLWALAAVFKLFGPSALAARLVSVFSAAGVVVLTSWLGALWGGRASGLRTGVVLAACPLFLVLSTIVNLDMFLTLWVTAGVAAFAYGIGSSEEERPRRDLAILLGYCALGLAVLTKGPVALAVPGLVWLSWRPVGARVGVLPPRFLAGSAVFLLVAAPWFVWTIAEVPGFADFFFVKGNLGRLSGADGQGVNTHGQPFYFYLPVLLGGSAPWIAFLATPWGVLREELRAGSWPRLAWSWIVPGLLFFSLVAGKLPGYVLPLFPGVALLVGRRWTQAACREDPRGWRIGAGAVIALASLAASTALLVAVFWPWKEAWWAPMLDRPLAVLAGALLGAGGACVFLLLARSTGTRAFQAMSVWVALELALGSWLKVSLDASECVEGLALAVKASREPGEAVVCVYKYLPLLAFHLGEPVLMAGSRGELVFGSVQLGKRPELFLDLPALKDRVAGARRVFLTVSARRAESLGRRLDVKLHLLARTRNTLLLSNKRLPWAGEAGS